MLLLVILLMAGFVAHYIKYHQMFPGQLMEIIELVKGKP
jgi:hypothetical protein